MPLPADPITLDEKQEVTKLLLACGREYPRDQRGAQAHLGDQGRPTGAAGVSGTSARAAAFGRDRRRPGRDRLGSDGSRCFHFRAAREILEKYGILERVPARFGNGSRRGVRGEIAETPKPGDGIFTRVRNVVIGSNRLAVDAAAQTARQLDIGHWCCRLSWKVRRGRSRGCTPPSPKRSRTTGGRCEPPACVIRAVRPR